jgi:hypothetical protein
MELRGSGDSVYARLAVLEADRRSLTRMEALVDRFDQRLDRLEVLASDLKEIRTLQTAAGFARRFPGGVWGASIAAISVIAAVEIVIEFVGIVPLLQAIFRL